MTREFADLAIMLSMAVLGLGAFKVYCWVRWGRKEHQ